MTEHVDSEHEKLFLVKLSMVVVTPKKTIFASSSKMFENSSLLTIRDDCMW